MKVSRSWLSKHFKDPLPDTGTLAEALTAHAFEIEEHDEDMLDVKVLPDRAAYALSHRGIAYELSAILDVPMSYDQLDEPPPSLPATDRLVIDCDPAYVIRHTGALVRGVKVGPSPDWLRASLESVGQRSINNVVDVLNAVMFATGQPSGAFDLAAIKDDGGVTRIKIRRAEPGERITVLTGEEHALTDDMFAFTDAVGGTLLDIAGIKGGLSSGVTEKTTDLFLSCGTYDPVLLRRASQTLKLFTDASQRYQNRVSPELTMYGMSHILGMLQEVAGGELVGVVDFYPERQGNPEVAVSLASINGRLGASFTAEEAEGVFRRLKLAVARDGEGYRITAPFYRRDIALPEDVAEEVGRIMGYDRVPETPLPPLPAAPDQRAYRGMERVKDFLTERGFTEVSTPSFDAAGEVRLANPLQEERPWLRASLAGNMKDALARAVHVAPRVLGPVEDVRLFELGTVFEKSGEHLSLVLGYVPVGGKKAVLEDVLDALASELGLPRVTEIRDGIAEIDLSAAHLAELGEGYEPAAARADGYRQFSLYPFALRDIAVWTPEGTEEGEVANSILKEAGTLLARLDTFDEFTKNGRTSYAFRLVFESSDHTLGEAELSAVMKKVTDALNARSGFEVR